MQVSEFHHSTLAVRIGLILLMCVTGSTHGASLLDEAQRIEIVAAHNAWRRAVSVPDLRWADDLGEIAQRWADRLRAVRACNLEHSSDSGLGENLYGASAVRWSDGRTEFQHIAPRRVVDAWGSEKPFYDHASNQCAAGKVCGHYTQLVWRSSTEVGCGTTMCRDLSQVWVCNYRPAGNYIGRRPY